MAYESTQPRLPEDRQTIRCLYCDKSQEVSRKAQSVTCRFCNKSLKLQDVRFEKYEARRVIDTCGMITVDKKGNVVADKIHCGSLVIRGSVKGDIDCRGSVLIGPDATVKGDIIAPTLAVGAGAVLEGKYEIGTRAEPADPPPTE